MVLIIDIELKVCNPYKNAIAQYNKFQLYYIMFVYRKKFNFILGYQRDFKRFNF